MLILFLPKSQMAIKWFLSLTSRHKKTWDFFLITILRSWNYLTHLISKAHEIIVSVYCFTLMCFWNVPSFKIVSISKNAFMSYKILSPNYNSSFSPLICSFLFALFLPTKIWNFHKMTKQYGILHSTIGDFFKIHQMLKIKRIG